MGMGIGVGDGEGEGLRPEFTPYYRTPRKEAMQLRGKIFVLMLMLMLLLILILMLDV